MAQTMTRASSPNDSNPHTEGDRVETVELNLLQALNRAMDDEMAMDERVMIMGEDVGVDGGIFRVTDGLLDKYGENRVVDTPIAEMGIAGACLGLAINGFRPIGEFQFSGFAYQAMHHFESCVARYHKRTQGRFVPQLVFRMPYGAGVRALEHHSESKETYYAHTPGLKVYIPRDATRAYQMLRAAVRDPDPVIFMEPKYLYRRGKQTFEAGVDAEIPEFKGCEVVREGSDVTVVAYGAMFHRAEEAADKLAAEGIDVELIDVAVISPYDSETVNASVRKTGRIVAFHEAHQTLGMGAEITARIAEDDETFLSLEAPMRRVAAPDITVPLLAREQAYMPDSARLVDTVRDLMAY